VHLFNKMPGTIRGDLRRVVEHDSVKKSCKRPILDSDVSDLIHQYARAPQGIGTSKDVAVKIKGHVSTVDNDRYPSG